MRFLKENESGERYMSVGGRAEGDRGDGSRLAHQKYQHTPTAQCTPTIVNT